MTDLELGDRVYVRGCHDAYTPTIRAIDHETRCAAVSSFASWEPMIYPLRMLALATEAERRLRVRARDRDRSAERRAAKRGDLK